MLDTMFRSGVPPHIGQLPVPGSDAESRAGVVPIATASATPSNVEDRNDRNA
jgi:hypothetical protein